MTTESMRLHPDIAELRAKYDAAAETPVAQATEGLTFMAALFLAISPWVVGFNDMRTLTGNNLIVGTALAVLALGFASAYGRMHGITWIAPLIGVWTIIAPWVVSGDVATTATVWTNVVTGVVIVLLGLAATSLGMRRTHSG